MKLTDNEIRTIWRNKAYDSRKQCKVLAELENCTYTEMFDRLQLLGLVEEQDAPVKLVHHGKAWGSQETAELIRMHNKGMSYKEIGDILGRTKDSVAQRLYAVGAK